MLCRKENLIACKYNISEFIRGCRTDMDIELFNALQVRFIKLHFTVAFCGDSVLPRDKVSAIRGGIGEMLLRMNCVRDRQCETCDFEKECTVQRILYSKFDSKPDFVTTDGGVGYVLECENYQEQFKDGEKLNFYLILFGKTIVHFYQLYQAISMLGELEGLGKYHAKYHVIGIKNMEGMSVLDGKTIDMDRYVVHMLYDYIIFRNMRCGSSKGRKDAILIFDTPLALKYQNEFIKEFQVEAILKSIRRRIYILNCFEGKDNDIFYQYEDSSVPKILNQEHHEVSVSRYSMRKNKKMILKGIRGTVLLTEITEDVLMLLMIGELIHIGKYTSFGFGRFHLKFVDL